MEVTGLGEVSTIRKWPKVDDDLVDTLTVEKWSANLTRLLVETKTMVYGIGFFKKSARENLPDDTQDVYYLEPLHGYIELFKNYEYTCKEHLVREAMIKLYALLNDKKTLRPTSTSVVEKTA
jgi:hypothetical protein